MIHRRFVAVCAFALMIIPCTAQNTILPPPFNEINSAVVWDSDVFAPSIPGFALGHQWGAADLDKINTALQMNVTADHFGWLSDTGHLRQLRHLGEGLRDTNYLVWGSPLVNFNNNASRVFTSYWVGMRWEPAENAEAGRTWTPRDDSSWPFSFLKRSGGSIPTSPSDVNYRRYVLQAAYNPLIFPFTALDRVEPREVLTIQRRVNWEDPLGERFLASGNGTGTTIHEDSTDMRRVVLAVNLRRLDPMDTVVDDSVVAKIFVPYHMRWKDQVDTNDRFSSATHYMPFRRVPYLTADSTYNLPMGRGREVRTRPVDISSEFFDAITITRRMLPLHSDPGDPDITIVAEFRTDTIWDIRVEDEDTLFGIDRRAHVLKTGRFDYPRSNVADATLYNNGDTAAINKRYGAIDSVGVRIDYHGRTSIAIRSASLLTPQTKSATSGAWDSTWATMMATHIDSMKSVLEDYEDTTGRTIRAVGFYLCDEYRIEHLLGMRYRLELLDRRLTTEAGYASEKILGGNVDTEFGAKKIHGFPSRFLWLAGLGQPDRQVRVPYLYMGREEGFNTAPSIPAPSVSIKLGYHSDLISRFGLSHETRIWSGYYPGNYVHHLPFADSLKISPVFDAMIFAEVGPAGWVERELYRTVYGTGNYFFARRRYWWTNHFYHTDQHFAVDSAGRPYAAYSYKVPLTGEWVRLGHGMALMLGAKGFMYDKWRHGYPAPPIPDTLNLASLLDQRVYPAGSDSAVKQTGMTAKTYFPGPVAADSTARAWDTDTTVSADSLFRSSHIGTDYHHANDQTGIPLWMNLDTMAAYTGIGRLHPGSPGERFYIGHKSMQMESKWWHDLVTDTTTRFRRGTSISNAEIFMKTRPIGWFGHGYRQMTVGDSIRLRKWVDAFADSVRTFRWEMGTAGDTTLRRVLEPVGERLYDIVLMDTSEAAVSDDNCIIALMNRRSTPWLHNTTMTDSIEFISSYDFDTLTRNSRPDLRYQQLGSRRIVLPFDYTVDVTKPYLLHVRELRPDYDSMYTIDTILNWNSDLEIDFMPGQTRFFHVKRLQAIDTVGAGYLAYSTQNKMVVWPVLNATGTAYTDSLRYHAVYHRRDTDPSRTGPWSVYYQRSRPYHRDSMPLVAGLDWEAPIRLSKVTMASTPSTDGFSRTRYYDADSTTYESHVDDSASANRDCCCGFPSLVIRETQPLHPKVFVVYACEDEWARLEHRDSYFHIVENAFPDAAVLNPGLLDVNGKSLVIATKSRGHDGGGDTLKSLALHGTPVINAAANNHMYYAWSASNAGIGIGLKRATDDWFPSPLFINEVPKEWVFWFPNPLYFLEIAGDEPLYPSLNVYSNIAQGQTDATLVWQDGAANKHIRYTRLVPKITDNVLIGIDRMLPHFVDMSFDSSVPPKLPIHGPAKIAIVGGASVNEEAELPVVVRSLQQDTMSMYIDDEYRDPTGIFSYNHESVAYGEWIPSTNMHRVRYNHFVDRQTPTKPELHYWWVGTTHGGNTLSLFHPVITNGLPRYDSLTWQGMVNDTLVTYNDSLHIFHGDLSDSALILNYSVLNKGAYLAHRGHKLNGDAVYWTGQAQFSALQTQQITLRRLPRVPAPPTTTYHYDFLRADGAWPHLSMRLREDWPRGIPSVRRILQYTATDAPSFIASAEQLYRETADNADLKEALPVMSRGIERNGERLTVRAALGDGRNIELFPVYDSLHTAIPPGFGGSQAMTLLQASMTQPVATFVSQPFAVGNALEMKILSTGLLRQGLDISIEEVDLNDEQSSRRHGANPRAVAMSAVGLAFAMADDEKPERVDKARYVLTQGDGKLYRLRLTNEATNHDIYREDLDIAPDEEVFEKSHELSNLSIIDLRARSRSITLSTDSRPQVFPNPSTGSVTIAFALSDDQLEHVAAPGSATPQLFLDVTDALGNVIISTPVAQADALELSGLSTGAYVARLRSVSAPTISIQNGTTFVVVR